MKQFTRIVALILCVSAIFLLRIDSVLAETIIETDVLREEEKIYSNATIEQNFDDSSVIVILDKNVGGFNKIHDSKALFSGIEFESIKDLSYVETPSELVNNSNADKTKLDTGTLDQNHLVNKVNHDTFRQIIQIKLPINSKANVLKVIKQLEKMDGVLYAGPSYYYELCSVPNDTDYYNSGVKFDSSRNHDISRWPCEYLVSDINGDGKDDLVVNWRNNSGKLCSLVYKGSSTGLKAEAVDALTSTYDYDTCISGMSGDFNGDGYSDTVVFRKSAQGKLSILYFKGQANATFASGIEVLTNSNWYFDAERCETFISDVNNDQKDDFIYMWSNNGHLAFTTYLGAATQIFNNVINTTYSAAPTYFNYNPL